LLLCCVLFTSATAYSRSSRKDYHSAGYAAAGGGGGRGGGATSPKSFVHFQSNFNAGPWTNISSIVNVLDFGAKGDGKADETSAFQKALNLMSVAQGGVVLVPRGLYRFNGNIVIPPTVTLEGVYTVVPSHAGIRDKGEITPTVGSVLMPYAGKGDANATAFITMQEDSVLRGFVIYYPEQVTAGIPVPYPFTISMSGNNPAVTDIELLNPYQGIQAISAHRHYIARVQGQPLLMGIYVDATYDIGRIEDVHWNPWFSMETALFTWQQQNGRAFVFARTDWEYVLNTFAFGYNIGYHFVSSPTGSCNGNFLGIGADNCYTSIKIDACDVYGILVTNGEFTSFVGPDPTEVVVSSTNSGKVQFVNTAFWGPGHQIAKIDGSGTVGFIGCTFCYWNADQTGRYAIQASGTSNLIVQGSEFQHDSPQISLGQSVRKAVITGNIITGKLNIDNLSKGNIQIGLNASDE
jgi:hypothetical protein